jgi:hypothetical protein
MEKPAYAPLPKERARLRCTLNHMPDVVFFFGILRTGEIRWQAGDFSPASAAIPADAPRKSGVRELAREHIEEAIRTLAAIMQDGNEPAAARVRAAEGSGSVSIFSLRA